MQIVVHGLSLRFETRTNPLLSLSLSTAVQHTKCTRIYFFLRGVCVYTGAVIKHDEVYIIYVLSLPFRASVAWVESGKISSDTVLHMIRRSRIGWSFGSASKGHDQLTDLFTYSPLSVVAKSQQIYTFLLQILTVIRFSLATPVLNTAS